MRAIQYDAPRSFSVVEIPAPTPGEGEVLVKIVMTGVCGTDRHLHEGEFGPRYPLTPGHEMVGEVVRLGAGVTTLVAGDRVVLDNSWSCGQCEPCRRHMGHYCEVWESRGINLPGGFAEYVAARETKCWVVNDIPVDTAVLAEPTACVVHGLDRLRMDVGSSVVVFGAGPTGLILTQLLRASGAFDVTVCGSTQFKLNMAEQLGATRTVTIDRADLAAAERSLRAAKPHGYDVVIDATGALSILGLAIPITRTGGTVLVYGMTNEADVWPVSPYDIFRRELTIMGSVSQVNCFDRAVLALRNGVVKGDGFITHRFGLEQYADALEASADSSCIKPVIEPAR
ncbi:MAG: zinc-dependent alcohol dehydrogenase family protein [Actinomycetes bacterium]